MKIVEINKCKFEIYDSIKEMPMGRYSCLNKILVQDIGFGSTFEDCRTRLGTLAFQIHHKDFEKALIELQNLQFGIFSTLEKSDIKSRLFLCFCKKINGIQVENPEDESECRTWFQTFNEYEITVGQAEEIYADLKKKLILN